LLLSAQASPQGVPKELLEAKKLELMQEKVCEESMACSIEIQSSSANVVGRLKPIVQQKRRGVDEMTKTAEIGKSQ
jgi:hypothetical protein